jgi:hypothetical protein
MPSIQKPSAVNFGKATRSPWMARKIMQNVGTMPPTTTIKYGTGTVIRKEMKRVHFGQRGGSLGSGVTGVPTKNI